MTPPPPPPAQLATATRPEWGEGQSDVFLNMEQAALFLQVKVSTLYAWVHRRLVPHRKHGGRNVFSRNDLLQWSEARRVHERDGFAFILSKNPGRKRETLPQRRASSTSPNDLGSSLTTEADEEVRGAGSPVKRR